MAVRAERTRRGWTDSSASGRPRPAPPASVDRRTSSCSSARSSPSGLLALAAPGPTGADDALATLLAWLQPLFGWLWSVVYAVMTLWAIGVVLLAAASRGRRRLLVDQATASALAFGASIGVGALAGTHPSDIVDGLVSSGPPVVYVASRVAVLTAIIVTASPHLARPWRYASRVVIALGALAAIGLNATNLLGASAGIAVGIAAAAITHLVLGSPQGRLTDAQVQVALADLGVPTTRVSASPDPTAVDLLVARTEQDTELRVTVYGRDAWDSQLVGSLWTALTRRGERAQIWGTRRSRVEHEALFTLLASEAGVPTLDVVAVGVADQGDALLVTTSPRASLGDLDAETLDDELLAGMWRAVVGLNRAGIAHGRIDSSRVVVRLDGTPALADFDAAGRASDEGDVPHRPGPAPRLHGPRRRTGPGARRGGRPPSAPTASPTCCPTCSRPRSAAGRAPTSARGPGRSTSCAPQRSPPPGSRNRRWNACGG